MATAPQLADPIVVRPPSYKTERYQFSPKGGTPLDFGTEEEPDIIATPPGVSELLIQERRCGDVYVEVSGPGLCKSTTADLMRDAVARLFSQVSA